MGMRLEAMFKDVFGRLFPRWLRATDDGELLVNVQGGMDARGNYPATWYPEPWIGTVGAADNAEIYNPTDVSMFNVHYIECTAGVIDIDVSIDGVNYIPAIAVRNLVSTTPTVLVVEAAVGVAVELRGKFERIRVLQKGAVASNARGSHGVI